MTLGPIVSGAGMALLSGVEPGKSYGTGVLPGVLVFALGMSITVAPLTAAVLASVGDAMTGVASGVNNAVARLAGLLAVAALPALAGIGSSESMARGLDRGFSNALLIAAAVCALGGLVSAALVRDGVRTRMVIPPSPFHACHDPCIEEGHSHTRSRSREAVGS